VARQHTWLLADVPWSDCKQFIRGWHDGLPLLTRGLAPTHLLATYRQLRKLDRRPGGADPVAVLYLRHKASLSTVHASLYLISTSLPVRPMTPAKWTALAKANLAKRICPKCGRDRGYVIPAWTGGICVECFTANESAALKEAA
jgi:hypothetical protein